MQLTSQQQSFLTTSSIPDSIALFARAGSGKTFMLSEWGKLVKKSGMSISFSKSTTNELAKRMPSRFPAKTFHGLGYQTLKGNGKSISLNQSKMFDIVRTLSDENSIDFELQSEIRKLAIMAKTYGIQPDSSGPPGILPNTYESWENLADQYDIDFSPEILQWAQKAVILSNQSFQKTGCIDYDDMLYIPVIFPHRFPKFPTIIADEVQDFNLLQHVILSRLLLPGGRLIAAGDDRQAIYAFRGALTDSYDNLIDTFSMQKYPLTVSFRCPSEVIKVAQQYVPDIEAAPNAIQGSVLYPSSLSLEDLPPVVLCRNNAPLTALAMQCLVEGHTVEIAGRSIGTNLTSLVKRITKKNLKSDAFLDRLSSWREKEAKRYPRRVKTIYEKYSVLRTIANSLPDVESIQKHLEKLFPDPKSSSYRPAKFHFSTIHRAKGLEWPRVMFLDSHLLGKHAESPQEIQQEQNLGYVAVTRAQNELTFATSSSIEGLEE